MAPGITMLRRTGWMLAALGALALLDWTRPDDAGARPGGGHSFGGSRSSSRSYSSSRSSSSSRSYSSGRSSSSSRSYSSGRSSSGSRSSTTTSHGGGSSNVEIWHVRSGCSTRSLWIFLTIVIVCVGAFGIAWLKDSYLGVSSGDAWDSGAAGTRSPPAEAFRAAAPAAPPPARQALVPAALLQADPDFSLIVLQDFLAGLYTRAQELRGGGSSALAMLAPYVAGPAREALAGRLGRKPSAVTGVVVGAQELQALRLEGARARFRVTFEACYEEHYEDAATPARSLGFWVREQWQLERALAGRSRRPDQVRALHCPSCAGPVEGSQDDRCAFCGSAFGTGEMDWCVTTVRVLEESPRGPMLTGTVEEVGTDRPSVVDPELPAAKASLRQRPPGYDPKALQDRHAFIFGVMQDAWTSLEWDLVRPLVTDRFFLAQTYWIQAYRSQDLRNVIKNPQITRFEVVKLTEDRFFDAVTVRFWATCIDYTVHVPTGQVVGGNAMLERAYSEYWTLIRSREPEGASPERRCPDCGAPLPAEQASLCEHCGAKVVGGSFDWVLSRIEQDESYTG